MQSLWPLHRGALIYFMAYGPALPITQHMISILFSHSVSNSWCHKFKILKYHKGTHCLWKQQTSDKTQHYIFRKSTVYPKKARNVDGAFVFIVNDEDYKQVVREEWWQGWFSQRLCQHWPFQSSFHDPTPTFCCWSWQCSGSGPRAVSFVFVFVSSSFWYSGRGHRAVPWRGREL